MSDTYGDARRTDAEDLIPLRYDADDYGPDEPEPAPPIPSVKKKRKRRASDVLLLLLALLLLGGGLVSGFFALRSQGYFGANSTEDGSLRDLNGNKISAEDPEILDPEYLEQADAQPLPAEEADGDAPGTGGGEGAVAGFRVPDLDMAVPLWAVNDVKGTLNPPGYREAYWVRNRGVSLKNAERGTVYVIMHTVRKGFGPGNYFIDVPTQSVTLRQNSLIYVNDRVYQYDDYEIVKKSDIGGRSDIWAETPGRLVIITCWLNKQGTLDPNNLVIYADLVS